MARSLNIDADPEGGKQIELPARIAQSKEAILRILHNHNLLAKTIWSRYETKSVTTSEGQTMFSLEKNVGTAPAHVKGTITSFGDGISILEEESVSRITMSVRWTVTEARKKTQASDEESVAKASSRSTTPITRYSLNESTVFSGFLLQAWFNKMHHGHTAHAELLVGLLDKIAAQEGSSMQVIPITIKGQDSGYHKVNAE